jgi:hypothetical protein
MKVVCDKDLRVSTLSGAVVLFKAGEPREVSDSIGSIAMTMGARQVAEAKPAPEPAQEIELTIESEVDTSEDLLLEVMEKLVDKGDPEDFKSDGTPKAAAVNRVAGRTVRTEEREKSWEAFLNS